MLCAERGAFLYQACPDLFPQGYLTDTEIDLWALYYHDREERLARARGKH